MKKSLAIAGLLIASSIAVGCGAANTNTANTNTANTTTSNGTSTAQPTKQPVTSSPSHVEILGAAGFTGQANLTKYEKAAAAAPTDVNAQVNAAEASYVNRKYDAAVSYYKKAIAVAPKNGVLYNYLGNVYLRGLGQASVALPYYQKAIALDPSYAYGWINLSDCQQKLGDTAAAKQTLQTSLTKVSKSDSLYSTLQGALKLLK